MFRLLRPLAKSGLNPVLSRMPVSGELGFNRSRGMSRVHVALNRRGNRLFILPDSTFPFFRPGFTSRGGILKLPRTAIKTPVRRHSTSCSTISVRRKPRSSYRPKSTRCPTYLNNRCVTRILQPAPLLNRKGGPISCITSSFACS